MLKFWCEHEELFLLYQKDEAADVALKHLYLLHAACESENLSLWLLALQDSTARFLHVQDEASLAQMSTGEFINDGAALVKF